MRLDTIDNSGGRNCSRYAGLLSPSLAAPRGSWNPSWPSNFMLNLILVFCKLEIVDRILSPLTAAPAPPSLSRDAWLWNALEEILSTLQGWQNEWFKLILFISEMLWRRSRIIIMCWENRQKTLICIFTVNWQERQMILAQFLISWL